METTDPREAADAPSTSLGTANAEISPQTEQRDVASHARWNWWILNHGLLIGGTLIGAALLTLGLRLLSDQRSQGQPSSTSVSSQTSTTGSGLTSASTVTTARTLPVTTVVNQVLAQTVAPPLATTLPSTVLSSAAASTSAAPVTSVPKPTSEPTTSTTQAETTAPATTSTQPPEPVGEAAKQLPHLQLGKIPATWIQVRRRMTSLQTSSATEPALSFRWVGPQKDTSILLQIASAAVPVGSGDAQTVRGHSAVASENASGTTIQWSESPGIAVGVTVHGFSESDALTFANNLVPVGDAEWARLLERAKLVSPPAWDQVLTTDW